MQILITHGTWARTRVLRLNRLQLAAAFAALVAGLMIVCAGLYHVVFVKALRDGWPVANRIMAAVATDDSEARDRFMRENLDAMARRVGEMQAKLVRLQAMSERVSGLAGMKFDDFTKPGKLASDAATTRAAGAAAGGPFVAAPSSTKAPLSFDALSDWVGVLDEQADLHADLFTLMESRLLEDRLQLLMVPSTAPVAGVVGSGFGFRSDPFSGRAALHTGLDFPVNSGTPIVAAAGGVVLWSGRHPQYGNMVELDHGKGLVTRYAHASKLLVASGDFVKRGETIAKVGSTGRSTGPHLHFEVLVNGTPRDPTRFLAGKAVHSSLAKLGKNGNAQPVPR